MTSLLVSPSRLLVPAFTRESISWRTVSPGIVEIAVDLENPGPEPTPPGDLVVETATLGAFVPSRPVARIALGSLEPGRRRTVTTRVERRLLEAPPAMPRGIGDAMTRALRAGGLSVTPEMVDLLNRVEWAGNLHVYFDRQAARAVEVHRALDLRVRAGRPVAIMVDVPTDRNRYETELRVSDPEWQAQVLDLFGMATVIVEPGPTVGSRVQVTLEVTRRKDGRTVPVEFSLESVA
jgi:hypothetical protein